MMAIRTLQPADDRKAVGQLYVDSWKYAYKGLLPQAYLDTLSAEQWANRLGSPQRHSLVAEQDGKIIGTASYGASRDAEFAGQGEIYSLYLLPGYRGKSYGRQLVNAVKGQLQSLGYKSAFLWVLEGNHRARGFYEKVGFTRSGATKNVEIGGKPVTEVQYVTVWDCE